MKITKHLHSAGFGHVELFVAVVVVAAFAAVGVRVLTVSHADSVSGVSGVSSVSGSAAGKNYGTVVFSSTDGTVTACRNSQNVFYKVVLPTAATYVQSGFMAADASGSALNVVTLKLAAGTKYRAQPIGTLSADLFWASISKTDISADTSYKGAGVLVSSLNHC